MGTCISLSRLNEEILTELSPQERKILRVVKMDGKVLEYRASIHVRDVQLKFKGYGVGVSRRATQLLPLNHELRLGGVYYLLPLDVRVRSSEQGNRSKRMIRVVVTKQQLQEVLSKNTSVEEVLHELQRPEKISTGSWRSWKPQLETIEETSEQFCF